MRLVVFDVDGTLVDSQAAILQAMAEAFAAADLPPPDRAAALAVVGLSLPVALGRLAPQASPAALSAMAGAYRAAYLRDRSVPPLYPGACDVLETLAAQDATLLGIATGKSRRGLAALLQGHGLTDRFVTRQTGDDHPSKPHPAMLQAALDEAGVQPRDAVMIGDTGFDMAMARAARVPAIGVTWGYHPAARLAGAAAIVDSFAQLLPALDRLGRP